MQIVAVVVGDVNVIDAKKRTTEVSQIICN